MATRRGCHVALQNFTRFGAGLPTALRKEGFVQDSEEPTRIRQPCNTDYPDRNLLLLHPPVCERSFY